MMHILNSKKIGVFALIAVFFLGVISCSSDDDGNNGKTDIEKGRQKQVVNTYDHDIMPIQNEQVATVQGLMEKAAAFSNNTSNATLGDLKTAWVAAFKVWQKNEIYNIGKIEDSFLQIGINQFPINPALIENNINGSVDIDNSYIASLGTPAKGFAALEYLLFDEDEASTLANFSTEGNATRRLQYVVALTQNLGDKTDQLKEAWEAEESTFKTTLESGVHGSQNLLVNAMVRGVENIKGKKLNNALIATPPDFTKLEAFRSGTSKEAIAINLNRVVAIYTGNFGGQEAYGMEQYVREVLDRPDLDDQIKTSFVETQTALVDIQGPLKDAVENQTEKVEVFQQKLTELIALFKVDLASAGQFVITFSDNDGD